MNTGDMFEGEIESMAFGGKGITTVSNDQLSINNSLKSGKDFIVFVDGGLEGQVCKIQITKKKRRFAEGKVIKVIKKASYQLAATSYQQIAGAPWFEVPIEIQMRWKAQQVEDLFRKFAGEAITFEEVIPSPQPFGYRNKMEYSFGPTTETQEGEKWIHSGFGLGFKKRGQYWLVESQQKPSGLFDDELEAMLPEIEAWAQATRLEVYNQRTHEGFWRNLLVRKSFAEDKLLICMVTSSVDSKAVDSRQYADMKEAFTRLLMGKLGGRIKGVFWQESDSVSDSVRNYDSRELLWGEEKLSEQLSVNNEQSPPIKPLSFEISLESFFQTNPASAKKLYEKVCEYVSDNRYQISDIKNPNALHLTPKALGKTQGIILDLFCGTGTIGQIVANANNASNQVMPVTKVIGVEIVPEAVEDAKSNAERNGLGEMEFFVGDVGKFLKERPEFSGHIGSVILDPPRAGIAPKTLQKVIDLNSKRIVYVSCNPATMARDTQILKEAGYRLDKISMVDQFPHTAHTECVGLFFRTK